jgi:hypothetical protein
MAVYWSDAKLLLKSYLDRICRVFLPHMAGFDAGQYTDFQTRTPLPLDTGSGKIVPADNRKQVWRGMPPRHEEKGLKR